MRLIDADALFDFLTEQLDKETGMYSKGRNVGINIARSALHDKTTTPTITPPPNNPLTLEELREMDGEPAWVVEGTLSYHALVSGVLDAAVWLITRWNEREMRAEDYGKTWLAYRRKPEEGTK